jgi:dTDP-4-dehydrorhamnose reductase
MRSILITGVNGLLGQQLVKSFSRRNVFIFATSRGPSRLSDVPTTNFQYDELDVVDGPAVHDFVVRNKPSVIIHAAAMTQVDECESDKPACYNANVSSTRFLIDVAKQTGSRFILISTDFIFQGDSGPYREDDEPSPVNYYGSTKLVAETAVRNSGLDWCIVRTVLVYGRHRQLQRKNIVTWVVENLKQSTPIRVVNDQWRTPTLVDDLAEAIATIEEKNLSGIYHVSGEDLISPYELATHIAGELQSDASLITSVTSDELNQVAKRPPKTGFIISKAKKDFDYKPTPISEGIRKTINLSISE